METRAKETLHQPWILAELFSNCKPVHDDDFKRSH